MNFTEESEVHELENRYRDSFEIGGLDRELELLESRCGNSLEKYVENKENGGTQPSVAKHGGAEREAHRGFGRVKYEEREEIDYEERIRRMQKTWREKEDKMQREYRRRVEEIKARVKERVRVVMREVLEKERKRIKIAYERKMLEEKVKSKEVLRRLEEMYIKLKDKYKRDVLKIPREEL